MARNLKKRISVTGSMSVAGSCAALMIAMSAMAEPPAGDERASTTDAMLPAECFGGTLKREFTTRAQTLVYDNTHPGLYTNVANPRQVIDDVELSPGAAASVAFPVLINGINVGFTAQTVANFDIEVAVYNGINEASGSGQPINTQAALSTFVIQVRNLPNTGGFQTGMVDLSTLSGGGVSLPDGGVFLRIRFLQPGTTTLATTVTNTYASSWNTGGADWSSSLMTGRSYSGAFRDVNNDGLLDSTEFRNFTFPAAADQYLALRADLPGACLGDFNGDQVVDFNDYLDFVDAFSTGCP